LNKKKVYYGEYVPAPFIIPLSGIVFENIVSNRNEFTYVKITYTHVLDFPEPNRNYAMLVIFESSSKGWADGLGYTVDSTIFNYPCSITNYLGIGVAINPRIKCDLHTDLVDPYLKIYGFVTS
jgi:hypothetical protein